MRKVAIFKNILKSSYKIQFNNYCNLVNNDAKKRICIVGSGPAGFYAAQYLLKHLPDSYIDIIERLPVPFGLVRFGVAPDHNEVKNVINTFTKTAENPRCNFYGNLSLGRDLTLSDLKENYHAVILAYGADEDKKIGLSNEDENIIAARNFVAWYNGLPGYENLKLNLNNCHTACIVGQGNVAIDVARILLTPIDIIKKTDITKYALEELSKNKIKKVYLIGRRGPLQAAFTIKEFREMTKINNCSTMLRQQDFDNVQEMIPTMQRPRKRITELLLKTLSEQKHDKKFEKEFLPIFYRSPKSYNVNTKIFQLYINKINKDNVAIQTNEVEDIETDIIFRSIGYTAKNMDDNLNFNIKTGCINNIEGRVLKKQLTGSDNTIDDIIDKYENGLYTAGWVGTGPTGVILTTMQNSFFIAENICKDFHQNIINSHRKKDGIIIKNYNNIVKWNDWLKIDKYELDEGKRLNKIREKITDVQEMLNVAGIK